MSTDAPAFRKFTPAVERGITYAIAALEFDAKHGPALNSDAKTEATPIGVSKDDLAAAADWLRHQRSKHRE